MKRTVFKSYCSFFFRRAFYMIIYFIIDPDWVEKLHQGKESEIETKLKTRRSISSCCAKSTLANDNEYA